MSIAPCKVGGLLAGGEQQQVMAGQCVPVVPGEADEAAGCVTVSTPGSLPDMRDMFDSDIGGVYVSICDISFHIVPSSTFTLLSSVISSLLQRSSVTGDREIE